MVDILTAGILGRVHVFVQEIIDFGLMSSPPSNVSSRTSPERFLFASCLYTSLLSHLFFLESQRSKQSRPRGGAAGLRMCAEVQSKDCFVFSVLPKYFTLKDREMEISVCK